MNIITLDPRSQHTIVSLLSTHQSLCSQHIIVSLLSKHTALSQSCKPLKCWLWSWSWFCWVLPTKKNSSTSLTFLCIYLIHLITRFTWLTLTVTVTHITHSLTLQQSCQPAMEIRRLGVLGDCCLCEGFPDEVFVQDFDPFIDPLTDFYIRGPLSLSRFSEFL